MLLIDKLDIAMGKASYHAVYELPVWREVT